MLNCISKTGPVLIAALLAGCSQLPLDGPAVRDIDRGAAAGLQNSRDEIVYDYVLIDINRPVLETIGMVHGESMQGTFGEGRPQQTVSKIGVGDVVQLSIFESAAGGLFVPAEASARTGNFVSIPNLTVSKAGNITVPYAGAVHASGRSVSEVERDIERKLANRAIEPQVSISFVEQNASMVSVMGDALNGASKFKISGSGDRITDVIAKAGGLRYPGFEVYVTLQRKGRKATVHFPKLINSPNENIYVLPGDTVYLYREQQKYIAVGALGNTQQTSGVTGIFPFEQEQLSLNEALAKAGGLQDVRANPAQVFLYRPERRALLEKLGVDLSRFPHDQQIIPTIFRANYRDPSSFFFAQRFQMRNKDIIYVGNADAVELGKFTAYVRNMTSTVAGVAQDGVFTADLIKGGQLVSR